MIVEKKHIKFFICCIIIVICVIFYFVKNQNTANIYDFEPISDNVIADITTPTEETSETINIPEFNIISTEEIKEIDEIPENPQIIKFFKKLPLREITISAIGDLTLGSNYVKPYGGSFYEYYDLYGPEYFLENVVSIFNESDCVLANLECALTDNQDPAIRQSKSYCYKGYTEYTSILKAGNIDVVNLANNHSFDYSQEGYDDTINALNDAGIDYCDSQTVVIKEINNIKIGFVSSMGTYNLTGIKNGLDFLSANGVEVKIVSFHWGNMDERVANSSQIAAARSAIDWGADLIIGHHPHVLQGIEIYKGKYIAYSLGNFIFDGNVISDIENRTSIIFQQKFVLYGSEIVDSSINIIPILTTSNMSRNNFKPMLATDTQRDDILRKIEARSQSTIY